jgi:hypothetical protein
MRKLAGSSRSTDRWDHRQWTILTASTSPPQQPMRLGPSLSFLKIRAAVGAVRSSEGTARNPNSRPSSERPNGHSVSRFRGLAWPRQRIVRPRWLGR